MDPVYNPYVDPYAGRLAQLRKQQEQLISAPPQTEMYSPEEQARRQAEQSRMQQLGNLGMMSNDQAVMGVAEPMLKRSMEASKPKYTEHGAFDETSGKFRYFPGYQESRRLEALNKNLQATEQSSAAAQLQWQRDRARSQDQMELRALVAGLKMSGRGGGGGGGPSDKGSLSFAGTDANGMPILMHSKHGPVQRDAQGNFTAYDGPLGPKNNEMPSTVQKAYGDNRAGNARVDEALAKVTANPDAVGRTAILPDVITQYIPENPILPGGKSGVDVRAVVANLGSLKIHDRSGAAVTASETPRLRPFIPNARLDSPETIATKLRSFRLEYDTMIREIEAGYPFSRVVANSNAALGPSSSGTMRQAPQSGPAAPAGGLSRQQQLESKYGIAR